MVNTASVFAHVDDDGSAFLSFDVDYSDIDSLEPPEETLLSAVEYLENQFFLTEDADKLLEQLDSEADRQRRPRKIGSIRFDDENILSVSFSLPQNLN